MVSEELQVQSGPETPQDLEVEFFTANSERTLEILELLKNDDRQTLVLPGAEINIETDHEGRVKNICIINRYGKNITDTISKTFRFNGNSAHSSRCMETYSCGDLIKLVYARFDENYQLTEYGATYYYPRLEKYWVLVKDGMTITHFFSDYKYRKGANQPDPCMWIYQIGDEKPVMQTRKAPDQRYKKVKCTLESLH